MIMFKLESGSRLMDRRLARKSAVDHVDPRQRRDRLPHWPSRGRNQRSSVRSVFRQPAIRKEAVAVGNAWEQHQRGKERKGLRKIRRGLIHAIGQAAKRWDLLFATACRPTITSLPADQMRGGYQMHKTENDTAAKEPKLDRHTC